MRNILYKVVTNVSCVNHYSLAYTFESPQHFGQCWPFGRKTRSLALSIYLKQMQRNLHILGGKSLEALTEF